MDDGIEIIFGPMFSGKTTELLRRLRRYKIAKHKVLLIKFIGDNRYSDKEVVTHDGVSMDAINVKLLAEIEDDEITKYDCIGIDEGQFIADIDEYAEKWANMGKKIVISSLSGDYKRLPFGNVLNLISKAEKIKMLTAICIDCGKEASYSKRKISFDGTVKVGGKETYDAVCRKCYFL